MGTINMNLYDQFSSSENLKKAFFYLEKELENSTLPLDPIWNPAISSVKELGEEFFLTLSKYINIKSYIPDNAGYIYANKDNLGVRPICVLSVVDRVVYQALVNPEILGNTIDSKLFNFCFANRVYGKSDFLESYQTQWNKFCDVQIESFNENYNWRVEFDIQAYFESISTELLIKILEEDFNIKNKAILELLKFQLKKWAESPIVGLGIPQGPKASHILANAYLYPLDRYINHLKGEIDFKYYRYVDDLIIMTKNPNDANDLIDRIVQFLRKYNLRLNEKTKLGKLKNDQILKELKFYNSYGGMIRKTSKEKVDEIEKKLPNIFKKIKSGKDLEKNEKSGLRYYLKASSALESPNIINNLISLIPYKPSLIYDITNYVGIYFYDNIFGTSKAAIDKYDRILKIYSDNSLSQWGKFCLLKILTAPAFAKENKILQKEISKILLNNGTEYLKIIALSYRAYAQGQFDSDDIKRFVENSNINAEKAVYYYFLIYLKDQEKDTTLYNLITDAIESSSSEIQIVGLFLSKKLSIKLKTENVGEFSRIFLKLPEVKELNEKTTLSRGHIDYLNFEGKIATDQFATFMGITKSTNNKITKTKALKTKILKAGKIKYDKQKGKLQFSNERAIDVQPENQDIKYLELLLVANGEIVKNAEAAKFLELNSYFENITDKDMALEIQTIKKKVRNLLLKCGMQSLEIDEFILPVKGIGYKLNIS